MTGLREKFENNDSGPKNDAFFPILDRIRISPKIHSSHFKQIFTGCHQVQLQKNLILRFRKNFKNIEFGAKNDPFAPFGHYTNST